MPNKLSPELARRLQAALVPPDPDAERVATWWNHFQDMGMDQDNALLYANDLVHGGEMNQAARNLISPSVVEEKRIPVDRGKLLSTVASKQLAPFANYRKPTPEDLANTDNPDPWGETSSEDYLQRIGLGPQAARGPFSPSGSAGWPTVPYAVEAQHKKMLQDYVARDASENNQANLAKALMAGATALPAAAAAKLAGKLVGGTPTPNDSGLDRRRSRVEHYQRLKLAQDSGKTISAADADWLSQVERAQADRQRKVY